MSQPRNPASAEPPVVIRPSFRLVRPFYTLAFVLLAFVYFFNNNRPDSIEALLVVPLLVFLWTVWRHVQQYFTVMTVTGGKLRYETGILSKTTRTLDVAKIQDVTVGQSMLQRLVNVGNLGIETAGERGGLSISNVDRPQQVAEYILDMAGK